MAHTITEWTCQFGQYLLWYHLLSLFWNLVQNILMLLGIQNPIEPEECQSRMALQYIESFRRNIFKKLFGFEYKPRTWNFYENSNYSRE